jgi:hypothetical protein
MDTDANEARIKEIADLLLPDAAFHGLFSAANLESYRPAVGSTGVDPQLIAYTYSDTETPTRRAVPVSVAIFGAEFNDWETRRAMCADLGKTLAKEHKQVVALVLISEAWMRGFTPEEHKTRDPARLIETYDDKKEMVVVMGRTLDGRSAMATALLTRDARDKVQSVGQWDIHFDHPEKRVRTDLLDVAFRAYLFEVMRSIQPRMFNPDKPPVSH